MSEDYVKQHGKGASWSSTTREWGNWATGAPYEFSTPSFGGVSWLDTFSGGKLPQWRDIIRNGGDATTNASGYRCRIIQSPIKAMAGVKTPDIPFDRVGYTSVVGKLHVDLPPGNPPSSTVVDDISNAAISKFINRVQSVQHGAMLGETIGETKKTLDGIVSPLSSLRRHTLRYFDTLQKRAPRRRRNGSRAKALSELTKTVANTYLEFNFGWNPLASSIADAVVAHENQDRHFSVYPVESWADRRYYGDSQFWQPVANGSLIVEGWYKDISTQSVRFKGSVRSGADENGRLGTMRNLGLDLPQFVPTLWNLLPYSFVVDYFLNIGDYLQARSFRFADLTYCCKTMRNVCTREYSDPKGRYGGLPFPDNSTKLALNVFGGHTLVEIVRFSRSRATPEDLVPVVKFSLPLSSKPWVNIGALIASRHTTIVNLFKKILS